MTFANAKKLHNEDEVTVKETNDLEEKHGSTQN